MGIFSALGIISEPITTVTNLETGGFYSFDHTRHEITIKGGEATITHKKGKKKGQVEKLSVLRAAQIGYVWGSLYF